VRHDALRHQIRRARLARGLSQAALAARGGASRVTVARLETGSAQQFRLETLAGLCEALGLELVALPRGAEKAQEVLLLRERERTRRVDERRRHAVLAARLLAARPGEAAALVRRARECVDLWEREKLCSRHYVTRWRERLAGPIERVALALLVEDEWTDALFQSSPWSFVLEPAAR
jgi:transcriptional regulator with XRE-family HTH domain